MLILLNIGIVIASSIILIKAVTWFINSSSSLALRLGISSYTISFLLVAIATSLPEAVVGITAAIEKNPILAYGNAIGSNIALLTLIIAIPTLLGNSLSTRHIINSKDVYYSAFFCFLPLLLASDGTISSTDGVILLVAYGLYTITLLKRGTRLEQLMENFGQASALKQLAWFLLSLGLLMAASRAIVYSTINISTVLGWSVGFIGLTIVAVGTSLPEIAYVVGSIKRNQQEGVLGNVIGSVVANSTFVLGITSILHPIQLKGSRFSASTVFFLVISLLLFLKFTKSKEKLDRFEGIVLLILYILFIAVEYYLQI